jgi:hypothetical protein
LPGDDGKSTVNPQTREREGIDKPGRRSESSTEAPRRPALDLSEEDDEQITAARKRRGKTIAEYAQEKEVDPQELYKLAVPIGDEGETLSIGELKDRVKEHADFNRRRDEFEEWRELAINEVASGRMQVNGLFQRLGQVLPRETIERLMVDHEQTHTQQIASARTQLREWFPEWDDAQIKARDREKLDEHLGSYGFSRFEIENLSDPRLVRYAVHAMRLMERYQRLKTGGQREKIPTTTPTSARKPKHDAKQEAANLAKSGDVMGAVRKLLG